MPSAESKVVKLEGKMSARSGYLSASQHQSRNILERLKAGETIIGDGGFVFCLERRGYVAAGPWTPE